MGNYALVAGPEGGGRGVPILIFQKCQNIIKNRQNIVFWRDLLG